MSDRVEPSESKITAQADSAKDGGEAWALAASEANAPVGRSAQLKQSSDAAASVAASGSSAAKEWQLPAELSILSTIQVQAWLPAAVLFGGLTTATVLGGPRAAKSLTSAVEGFGGKAGLGGKITEELEHILSSAQSVTSMGKVSEMIAGAAAGAAKHVDGVNQVLTDAVSSAADGLERVSNESAHDAMAQSWMNLAQSRIRERENKQLDLKSGNIKVLGLLDEQMYNHVYRGLLESAQGDRAVVLHFPEKSAGDFMQRLRKEDAAQDLSPYLFDTVEPSVRKVQDFKGGLQRSMVREFVGNDIRSVLEKLDPPKHEGMFDGTPHDFSPEAPSSKAIGLRLYDLMASDPQSRKSLEEAVVERTILGDRDIHEMNFRGFMENGSLSKVASIDLERGFNLMRTPTFTTDRYNTDLVSRYLRDQPLLESTVDGINGFLSVARTSEWRSQMLNKGNVNENELEAVVARAEALAKTGRYPSFVPNNQ